MPVSIVYRRAETHGSVGGDVGGPKRLQRRQAEGDPEVHAHRQRTPGTLADTAGNNHYCYHDGPPAAGDIAPGAPSRVCVPACLASTGPGAGPCPREAAATAAAPASNARGHRGAAGGVGATRRAGDDQRADEAVARPTGERG